MTLLAAPAPRWLTIAPHRPFLADLAAGLWREFAAAGPEALADVTVLLPNRRSMRALADAFVACAEGRALLPPQMRPLGDLDEGEAPFEPGDLALDLPPAIGAQRRRFELAGLVAANEHLLDRRLDAAAALELADALAAFLDAVQIEEVGDVDLAAAVDGDHAAHWKRSADFLDLALTAWPQRLAELGLMDVAARRVALIRALETRWRAAPPSQVLVAAGSTGSTPAVAGLLAAIAAAPRGLVVLPGLDVSLAETAWRAAAADDQHPQGALSRLLAGAGVPRAAVRPWLGSEEAVSGARWRRRVINEALRPAELTADWLSVIGELRREAPEADPIAEGLRGLTQISARGEDETAAVAALLLREALETPGRTAALVTPDAALARRTAARLARWGVVADSSVGQPLAITPPGVLALLAAWAIVDPTDPVTLLAILKHPLTRLGGDAAARLETLALRGPRAPDWEKLEERASADPAALALAQALAAALAPAQAAFAHGEIPAAAAAARALAQTLEALTTPSSPSMGEVAAKRPEGVEPPPHPSRADARSTLPIKGREDSFSSSSPSMGDAASPPGPAEGRPEDKLREVGGGGGPSALWSGQAGSALAAVISQLLDESDALPPLSPRGFVQLLEGLLRRALVRPGGATHPRLQILGVLEARLAAADLVILAGLEEGVWPQAAPIDPFLSRPMRRNLGLPSPERRIGLSAHDFAQAACAGEVVLLHTERRDGAPTVESRWLWRLRTLIGGARLATPDRPDVTAWARALDAPLSDPPPSLMTARRPAPRPPVASRPRQLSVTAVERWIRDPYAIYAQRILRLRPLDPPDKPIGGAERGSAIHAAFEAFAKAWPDALPPDAEAQFAALVLAEIRGIGMPAARMPREAALARNLAPWVVDFERRRRAGGPQLLVEQSGRHDFAAPGGVFALTARADRIEVRGAFADILDFKTGAAPSKKQVRAGLAPQLTLTAAILEAGGFETAGPKAPAELVYVRVTGRREPGKEEPRDEGMAGELARDALAGLVRRVARFDDESKAYVSRTATQFMHEPGDYDPLARVWEWAVIGEAEA